MERMLCPYRKRTLNKVPKFGDDDKGFVQSEELFAECQGDICPLYNDRMAIPCVRANKERNEAYIKMEALNGKAE